MAKKKIAKKSSSAKTRSTGRSPEENNYFDGMEPVSIAAIDNAIREVETSRDDLKSAKEAMEAAEAKLQRAMRKHSDDLGRNAEGHCRYLSKKLEIVAVLKVREASEQVSLKRAPKRKDG